MPNTRTFIGAAAAFMALAATPALAQDNYVSFSAGGSFLGDSDNAGAFTTPFTTGAGTTIPAGAVLPAGTPLGWTTEFENGYAVSAAVGRRFWNGNVRGELEIAYQSNDIDTHSNVVAGGIALDAQDAGVLITGSPNLGVTVGDLVDDGEGKVATTFLMLNAYYDFPGMGPFKPYVGAGAGVGFVEVDYQPSGVDIVDDDGSAFAYQLIGGASYDLGERTSLFAQYRYRATEDVETEVNLFDADLEIENRASLIEAGVRFRF